MILSLARFVGFTKNVLQDHDILRIFVSWYTFIYETSKTRDESGPYTDIPINWSI